MSVDRRIMTGQVIIESLLPVEGLVIEFIITAV
jgi:hypothetical protein